MEKEEFVIRAKEMGYTDQMIRDIIEEAEEALRHAPNRSYKHDWSFHLIELPIRD